MVTMISWICSFYGATGNQTRNPKNFPHQIAFHNNVIVSTELIVIVQSYALEIYIIVWMIIFMFSTSRTKQKEKTKYFTKW